MLATSDSPNTKDIRSAVRAFCDDLVRPSARRRDKDEEFPGDLIPPMVELGLLGAAIPTEYGGTELDPWSYAAVMEELGAADSSVRSLVSVTVGLVGSSIHRWGNDEQRQEWLPQLTSGGLGAFGLTEPGAGSNPGQLQTRATWENGGWTINGSKIFITNGSKGILTLVFARAVRDGDDQGITCLLVPQRSSGYVPRQIHGKLGIRGSDTAEVSLDGVKVGADSVLGEVGGGMKVALSALDSGRFALSAASIGVACEAFETALKYARQREQFGSPLVSRQLIQELLADSHIDMSAARGLVHRVAELKAGGKRFTLEASTAKVFATEAAVRCADRSVQILGGYGYIDEYPVQRLLRDARVTTLYEGTTQVQKLLIGRAITGVSSF